MPKKFTIDTKYINSLQATDKDGVEVIRFNTQLYLTSGIYICIEPGNIQNCPSHSKYSSWVKDLIKKLKAADYIITISTSTYGSSFSQEDINTYINS